MGRSKKVKDKRERTPKWALPMKALYYFDKKIWMDTKKINKNAAIPNQP
ncbi:hypothetical protein BSG1_06692 [Bacillus sp. SG-1]|nr:hypothetical protein BSG1_06692 [Bacillus sp. SG-1]